MRALYAAKICIGFILFLFLINAFIALRYRDENLQESLYGLAGELGEKLQILKQKFNLLQDEQETLRQDVYLAVNKVYLAREKNYRSNVRSVKDNKEDILATENPTKIATGSRISVPTAVPTKSGLTNEVEKTTEKPATELKKHASRTADTGPKAGTAKENEQSKDENEAKNEAKMEASGTAKERTAMSEMNEIARDDNEAKKEGGEMVDNSGKTLEPVCQIPKVDPFSPVVMQYVKKLPKTKCKGTRLSQIKDGILSFDVKNVKGALLIHINRNYDFWIDLNDWVSFTKNTKQKKLKEAQNQIGCIGRGNDLHINDDLKVTDKQCIVPHFFNFNSDGRLKILEKNRCIFVSEPKHMGKVSLENQCSTNQSEFLISEDGMIKHKATGFCLAVGNLDSPLKDQLIVLSADCNSTASKFHFIEPQIEDVKVETPIKGDCLKVMFVFEDNSLHVDLHLYAAPIPEENLQKIPLQGKKVGLKSNIAIVLFDSQSAANFRRLMPRTMDYLTKNKNSHIFKGHTVVGDATSPQLIAMLTGEKIPGLPEARRGIQNAGYIDGWPFIFNELHQNGYVTQFAEDDPLIGAFNLRFWGFFGQPTTHYGRPYWLAAMASDPSYFHPYSCIADKWLHNINIDYLLSLYKTHRRRRKFTLIMSSKLVHEDFNGVQYADNDLVDLLAKTEGQGLLNDTILIIQGDHGSRYGPLRESIQGKIEERLPFFSITLPERIAKEYPDLVKNMKRNTQLLTSHFDLYATLKHIISYPSLPSGIKYGDSLFTHLNESARSCQEIGVPETWCPCLTFENMNATDPFAVKVAEKAVSYLNSLLHRNNATKEMCAQLKLDKLTHIAKKMPNKRVQKYFYSASNSECATCHIVETNKNTFTDILYEISFVVQPGGGSFEAMVHDFGDGKMKVSDDISRINKYGTHAKCVENTYPHIRKYCFCI